jgi:16S rRNA processing protein RimM
LKLSGYENPEDAKALRGAALALPRDELPPPGRGEIYLADLEGLKVLSPDGSELGSIQCFQQVGDSEVMMVGGNVTDAVGVPFEPEFIQSASTEAGEVIVTEYALELFA